MLKLYIAILMLVFTAGCTQVVQVQHSELKTDEATANIDSGISTHVLIQPQAIANQKTHVESGLVVVGLVNSWDVDINETLPEAIRQAVSQTYPNVHIGHHCDECGLIIRPKVTNVAINKITMQADVALSIGVFDAQGRKITDIQTEGDSAFMDTTRFTTGVVGYFVPLLGTALGTTVVGKTVKDALNDALINFSDTLTTEANSGVLARTWLPNPNKSRKKLGKHQYTAEQLAKSAGCNMNTDDLRLVAEEYYQETYQAQCWGKPQFAITCEFGRCQLDDAGQGLAKNL